MDTRTAAQRVPRMPLDLLFALFGCKPDFRATPKRSKGLSDLRDQYPHTPRRRARRPVSAVALSAYHRLKCAA